RVGAPGSAPRDLRRHEEVEARHDTARTQHAGELLHGRSGIRHVTKQVREAHRVERGVGKAQRLRAAHLERDPTVEPRRVNPLAATLHHRFTDIDAGYIGLASRSYLDRYAGRAGGDVEHPVRARSGDMTDQLQAPAPVLTER